MMDIRREIRLKIREIREMRGFTQKELAKYMGKTQGYISSIENGEYSIGIGVLQDIAEVLKFDIKLVPKKLKK